MSRKVYVGNLPSSATESRLTTKFAEHGNVVRVKLVTDRHTGQSLGYAFIEMETSTEADRIIATFDGQTYDGWPLTVRSATPNRR
jgi:RNA recognition motif-containing protein